MHSNPIALAGLRHTLAKRKPQTLTLEELLERLTNEVHLDLPPARNDQRAILASSSEPDILSTLPRICNPCICHEAKEATLPREV